MNYIQLIGLFAIISLGILVALFIFATIITTKVRRRAREEINNLRYNYPTACAGSPMIDIPATVSSFPAEYIEFKDKQGNILNPKDFQIFIAKGESMQFAEIHDGYMIFARNTRNYVFPQVVVIRREIVPANQVEYKIRRGWKICNVREAKSTVEKIIQSKDFDIIRQLQPYDSDNLLLEDFINKRLKRYIEQHPFCENTNDKYGDIIISTTYHTEESIDPEDRGKIRFSIHPTSLLVGEVTQSFPR